MFSIKMALRGGMEGWIDGLRGRLRRKGEKVSEKMSRSGRQGAAPETEAERSLHQAMGWTENAWDDEVGDLLE